MKYAFQMEVKERTAVPFEESVKFGFCVLCDVGLPLRGVRLCSPGDPDWTGMHHVQKQNNRHKHANKNTQDTEIILITVFLHCTSLDGKATYGNISGNISGCHRNDMAIQSCIARGRT